MTAADRLRVLFDAHWWLSGPPSGRNVVTSVVSTWSRSFPGDRIILRVRRGETEAMQEQLVNRGIAAELRPASRVARVHAIAARTAGRAASDVDVVITQNFGTGAPGRVSAVLVHDAMYVEHPEWFTRSERAYLAALRPSLRAADLIFTTSESETARVGRVWPETASRLRQVGLATPVDLASSEPRAPAALPPGDPFILAAGRLNVRKNIARLIEAYRLDDRLPASHRLVIVGSPDGLSEPLPPTAADRVVFLRDIDDAELRWLYQHAALFVMPSLDEGFGLPLLEARDSGARVVASDIRVFRELGADGYFDPLSVEAIGATMRDALTSAAASQHEPGRTWEDVVARMRTAVIGRREGSPRHAMVA